MAAAVISVFGSAYAAESAEEEKYTLGEISGYAVSSAGLKTTDKYDDGKFYASVEAETKACNKAFTLIIAQYDGDSKLLKISAKKQSVYDTKETLTSSLTLEDDSTGGFVKVFVWDDSVKPLAETYSMKERYSLDGFEDAVVYFPGYRLKAVTFSFDDCLPNDTRLMSILDKYNLIGTFNLQTSKFYGKDEATRQTVFNRYNTHHEIASHSRTHPKSTDVLNMTVDAVAQEIADSLADIKDLFGIVPKGLAWPGKAPSSHSDYDKILEWLSDNGIKYARDSWYTYNYKMPSDWLKWNAACSAKKLQDYTQDFLNLDTEGELVMLSSWGHASDFTSEDMWTAFDEACASFKDRDDVWKASNIDICLYDLGVKKLSVDALNGTITNAGDVELYIEIDGIRGLIPANTVIKFK